MKRATPSTQTVPDANPRRLVKFAEAARILRVTEKTLLAMERRGEIEVVRIGGKNWCYQFQIDALLDPRRPISIDAAAAMLGCDSAHAVKVLGLRTRRANPIVPFDHVRRVALAI